MVSTCLIDCETIIDLPFRHVELLDLDDVGCSSSAEDDIVVLDLPMHDTSSTNSWLFIYHSWLLIYLLSSSFLDLLSLSLSLSLCFFVCFCDFSSSLSISLFVYRHRYLSTSPSVSLPLCLWFLFCLLPATPPPQLTFLSTHIFAFLCLYLSNRQLSPPQTWGVDVFPYPLSTG